MQSCLISKKTNPRKRRRRRGRLRQRPVEPEAKRRLAGQRSECTTQILSCSTAAKFMNDFENKRSNTLWLERLILTYLTAQLAPYRA